MRERIRTLHPDPEKKGVNIDQGNYEVMAGAILEILKEKGVISFQDLRNGVESLLEGNFEGSIGWYKTTVKLDLEAWGILERIQNRRPQKIQLTS